VQLRAQDYSLQQIAKDLQIGYGTVRATLALAKNLTGNDLYETNIDTI